jgi:hypothetical protein
MSMPMVSIPKKTAAVRSQPTLFFFDKRKQQRYTRSMIKAITSITIKNEVPKKGSEAGHSV